ncbi:hypothetical protein ACLK1S_19180 [Escherichia coli]
MPEGEVYAQAAADASTLAVFFMCKELHEYGRHAVATGRIRCLLRITPAIDLLFGRGVVGTHAMTMKQAAAWSLVW